MNIHEAVFFMMFKNLNINNYSFYKTVCKMAESEDIHVV